MVNIDIVYSLSTCRCKLLTQGSMLVCEEISVYQDIVKSLVDSVALLQV